MTWQWHCPKISAAICDNMVTGRGNIASQILIRMAILYWNRHPILCRLQLRAKRNLLFIWNCDGKLSVKWGPVLFYFELIWFLWFWPVRCWVKFYFCLNNLDIHLQRSVEINSVLCLIPDSFSKMYCSFNTSHHRGLLCLLTLTYRYTYTDMDICPSLSHAQWLLSLMIG